MAYYLAQVAYTSEAWATQLQNPGNPLERVQGLFNALGGEVEHFWYAFGEYDVVAIVNLPDNVNMAAGVMAVISGGAVKAAKTTPLMTIDEGIEAMTKAGSLAYQPPSAG